MRMIDGAILVAGLIAVLMWSMYSSKDGFKGSEAMIVARSTTFSATLGGRVDNRPPVVGTKLGANDLLVRIHNGRVDRTRLVEIQAQLESLKSEVHSAHEFGRELSALTESFERRAVAYRRWLEEDVLLRSAVNKRRLDVAEVRSRMRAEEVERLSRPSMEQHASKVVVTDARANARIAASEVALVSAELQRSELMLGAVQAEGISLSDGDTNYWDKMADELRLRQFDLRAKVAVLKSELIRAASQAQAEEGRIASDFSEEHVAPFPGVVNAVFVTKGARVAPGTSLVQLLDCANPTVVIPVPAHRMGEFSVGMKATIYPVDSDHSLSGTVTHISSGPLLGHDSSIQLPANLTVSGNRAIVSLDEAAAPSSSATCETARNAVAVIHSDSLVDRVTAWLSTRVPEAVASMW